MGRRVARAPGAGSCSSSGDQRLSSSPKSGDWKGCVVGGGITVEERLGCPSRAEKSDVESMRDLPFVTGPVRGLVCRDRAQRFYNLVILA